MILRDLKTYLENNGYENIGVDTIFDSPDDSIGLFLYATRPCKDGTCDYAIQIQVRDKATEKAYERCCDIARFLDSGIDEELIDLTPTRYSIIRPTAKTKKLSHDESKKRTTYYTEISLWSISD